MSPRRASSSGAGCWFDEEEADECPLDGFNSCRSYRTNLLENAERLFTIAEALFNDGHRSVARLDDRHVLRAMSESELGAVHNRNRIDPGTRVFVVVPSIPNPKIQQDDPSPSVVEVGLWAALLHNNRLHGTVILLLSRASEQGEDDLRHISGGAIRDSTIGNSIVHLSNVRITDSSIEGAYVGRHACVESSRILGGNHDNNARPELPSEHVQVNVGAESGGQRDLLLDGSSTMIDVSRQLVDGHDRRTDRSSNDANSDSSTAITVTNFVGHHCRVIDTSRADRILLYPRSSLESAVQVSNVTLYPHATIANGCVVRDSLLQWHCQVSDLSTVQRSILMEQSHVGPHSAIAHSVLGPDVHVSNGEIHASVLGPNTNSHHQSLVISALWLSGRGNVGYGANVGSNHTGRAPDQEIVAGEGVFFGLSCVVKFPVNVAPYTLVSAGTQLSPQRMTMPFSLIANESLLPGWVLSSSPYTLARAEIKVSTRRKAKRHDYAGWPIFRPWTVQQCVESRSALLNAPPSTDGGTKLFTSRDTIGIGACVVTDKARLSGIRAYTDTIQRYALRGLLDKLSDGMGRLDGLSMDRVIRGLQMDQVAPLPPELATVDDERGVPWEVFPWLEDKSKEWDYQRYLLQLEFGQERAEDGPSPLARLQRMLDRLVELEGSFARRVHECKVRDDVRGHQTIPGYASSHVAAGNDPVVRHVQNMAADTEERARHVLAQLGASRRAESKL